MQLEEGSDLKVNAADASVFSARALFRSGQAHTEVLATVGFPYQVRKLIRL